MNAREAVALLAGAVPRGTATWADFGAGSGTFTRALLELLGPGSRVYAVDRDVRAIAALTDWAGREAPGVIPVQADFTAGVPLPKTDAPAALDGMLLANALHFVRDADAVLARLVGLLRQGGRVVLVEYDRRAASPWVPHPIPPDRLTVIAQSAGLAAPTITARRPSAFGGEIYVAAMERRAEAEVPRRD